MTRLTRRGEVLMDVIAFLSLVALVVLGAIILCAWWRL